MAQRGKRGLLRDDVPGACSIGTCAKDWVSQSHIIRAFEFIRCIFIITYWNDIQLGFGTFIVMKSQLLASEFYCRIAWIVQMPCDAGRARYADKADLNLHRIPPYRTVRTWSQAGGSSKINAGWEPIRNCLCYDTFASKHHLLRSQYPPHMSFVPECHI
jgi:hypothetical protein